MKQGIIRFETDQHDKFVDLPIDIAITDDEREQGLSGVASLNNRGMLFNFPIEQELTFWMKDCGIPLSIGFINEYDQLFSIQDMQPHTTIMYHSRTPCRQAVEVPQGFFEANGIRDRMKVQILPY